MESQTIRHNGVTNTFTFTYVCMKQNLPHTTADSCSLVRGWGYDPRWGGQWTSWMRSCGRVLHLPESEVWLGTLLTKSTLGEAILGLLGATAPLSTWMRNNGPRYLLGEAPPLLPAPNVSVPSKKGLWYYPHCSMLSSHFRYVSLCISTGIEHLKFLITGLVSICLSRVLAFKGMLLWNYTVPIKLSDCLSTIEIGHLASLALAARRRSFSQGHSPFSRQDSQALSRFLYRDMLSSRLSLRFSKKGWNL